MKMRLQPTKEHGGARRVAEALALFYYPLPRMTVQRLQVHSARLSELFICRFWLSSIPIVAEYPWYCCGCGWFPQSGTHL